MIQVDQLTIFNWEDNEGEVLKVIDKLFCSMVLAQVPSAVEHLNQKGIDFITKHIGRLSERAEIIANAILKYRKIGDINRSTQALELRNIEKQRKLDELVAQRQAKKALVEEHQRQSALALRKLEEESRIVLDIKAQLEAKVSEKRELERKAQEQLECQQSLEQKLREEREHAHQQEASLAKQRQTVIPWCVVC